MKTVHRTGIVHLKCISVFLVKHLKYQESPLLEKKPHKDTFSLLHSIFKIQSSLLLQILLAE